MERGDVTASRRRFRGKKDRELLGLLHQDVQSWILQERHWDTFWAPQRYAIERILGKQADSTGEGPGFRNDLLITAPTARGKTMAVFLPLLSQVHAARLGTEETGSEAGDSRQVSQGYDIMYTSPLRALIRQQGGPTSDVVSLCQRLNIRCTSWMSDIGHETKARSWDRPTGVLMITPESLESRFLRRSSEIESRFGRLRAVIIDELHAYFESPRGPQLISLLTRLEDVIGRRVPRYALSATLGTATPDDWRKVFTFLRPHYPSYEPPADGDDGAAREGADYLIDLNVRLETEGSPEDDGARGEIAQELRRIFDADSAGDRGRKRFKTGLIFANSRREVEHYTRLLNSEDNAVEVPKDWLPKRRPGKSKTLRSGKRWRARPSETGQRDAAGLWRDPRRYWPHHGSLNQPNRVQAEKRMQSDKMPCTLVATTTLELGIDVGTIEEVAQIGAGHSVASLRQRMGRSGRPHYEEENGRVVLKTPPPRLHIFLREPDQIDERFSFDALRLGTFQVLAQLRLLGERKFEVPDLDQIHLSTFVQQLLSVVHQHRECGISVAHVFDLLVRRGPFGGLAEPLFHVAVSPAREDAGLAPISVFDGVIQRLRTMHDPLIDLDIEDPATGEAELFLTARGVREVSRNTIYAAFWTAPEYTVRSGTSILGSIGLGDVYGSGDRILLAGHAWEITAVNHRGRVIDVRRAPDGAPAYFTGDALSPSAEVVAEMKRLYEVGVGVPMGLGSNVTLDDTAQRMIEQGRETYQKNEIASKRHVEHKDDVVLFPWVGRRTLMSVAAALKWVGMPATTLRVSVVVQNRSPEQVARGIDRLLTERLPPPTELARRAGWMPMGKFGHFLTPSLLRRDLASSCFGDLDALRACLGELREAI